MNTKIILSLGTSVLLASSLLAQAPSLEVREGCKQHKMQKHQKQGHRGPGLVKMFMKLDLSDEQRVEIKSIIKESMKAVPNPHTAFSDTNFNKDEFVKLAQQKRDYKLKHRAEIIEKIYKTLSDTQKKDFKTILDMHDIKKKMMNR